ncbi:hypothetical protein DL239_20385 [Sedimentitalea sp. CY04]|uniref:Uncharacterized protein n=1 Tax=Parasedimentitalea denitrificans TaxID=2211118 RepID=A0ABX0WCF3_9RHOB|nr:hypothetical protein [Sedimentitalea sp. CY04]
MIEAGNYNRDARDRTKWYAITDTLHLSKIAIAVVPDRSPLPDSKPTDIKQTPIPPAGADDLFKAANETDQQNETLDASFERFWRVCQEKWESLSRAKLGPGPSKRAVGYNHSSRGVIRGMAGECQTW